MTNVLFCLYLSRDEVRFNPHVVNMYKSIKFDKKIFQPQGIKILEHISHMRMLLNELRN